VKEEEKKAEVKGINETGNEDRTTTPEIEAQNPTDEPRPRSRWSKWKDILIFTVCVALVWGLGLFLGLGLPKIATPAITDLVWMAMVGWQIVIVYKEVSPQAQMTCSTELIIVYQ
jgi:hypothetical protein